METEEISYEHGGEPVQPRRSSRVAQEHRVLDLGQRERQIVRDEGIRTPNYASDTPVEIAITSRNIRGDVSAKAALQNRARTRLQCRPHLPGAGDASAAAAYQKPAGKVGQRGFFA